MSSTVKLRNTKNQMEVLSIMKNFKDWIGADILLLIVGSALIILGKGYSFVSVIGYVAVSSYFIMAYEKCMNNKKNQKDNVEEEQETAE